MLRTLSLAVLVLTAAACGDATGGAANPGRPRVAVIPKGNTHVFWQTVEQGALAGGAKAGLDVVFKGPLQENDRAQQIQLVQQFVADGVAGLALAPLDHSALVPAVALARKKGIPVVIFDSNLDGTAGVEFASYIATDNHHGGEVAGQYLVQLLGGKGKVVLLRYQPGSASTEAREAGFLDAVRAGGLEVVVDNRYAGATAGEAKVAALNLADTLRAAQGVFCSNESATAGMLLGLEQLGLAGKLRFVGFDASPPLVAGLHHGHIDGLVVQDPRRMGEIAVESLASLLAGKQVPAVVDTGCVLATKANLGEPGIKRLLE